MTKNLFSYIINMACNMLQYLMNEYSAEIILIYTHKFYI